MKIPLGLYEGSTENATVATALLSDLVDRGLDPEQAILFVTDGGKAIRRAIKRRVRRTRARAPMPFATISTPGLSRMQLVNPWAVGGSGVAGSA